MKISHKKNFLLMLLLAATLISCGSDDDDSNDTPQRQEDTTGSTGTTGTSGTSGTTGGGSTACLSSSRKEEIRTFFNEISDRDINGTGTIFQREGTTGVTVNVAGSYRFTPTSENSWVTNGTLCNVDAPATCRTAVETFSFRNGCFFVGNNKATVTSSSNTSLSYRYTDSSGRVSENGSVSSGKVRLRSTTVKGGVTVNRLIFDEL